MIYGLERKRHRVMPGYIIVNNSNSQHLAQGIVDGMPFDNFGSTWAPNGDSSVFKRAFYLLEPLPTQVEHAFLPKSASFH